MHLPHYHFAFGNDSISVGLLRVKATRHALVAASSASGAASATATNNGSDNDNDCNYRRNSDGDLVNDHDKNLNQCYSLPLSRHQLLRNRNRTWLPVIGLYSSELPF